MTNILVLGANSEVAVALSRIFAQKESCRLTLASRNLEELKKNAQDLGIRHQVEVLTREFDATDYDSHEAFYGGLPERPDVVVAAFGHLGDQAVAQGDFSEAKKILATNFLGAVSILEIVAADFESRGSGVIIAISSVAGERGRADNYLYGSAKAGLSAFTSGLRNRLHSKGVRVLTVKPGFIRTKMIRHLKTPRALTAPPARVARDIYRAYRGRRDVVYTPWFWRWIMLIFRALPEIAFKRMRIS